MIENYFSESTNTEGCAECARLGSTCKSCKDAELDEIKQNLEEETLENELDD